jgi:type III secretory pathway component EscU
MVGLFINNSFKVVARLMFLSQVVWLTFMQNVGAFKRLGKCSTRCCLDMW